MRRAGYLWESNPGRHEWYPLGCTAIQHGYLCRDNQSYSVLNITAEVQVLAWNSIQVRKLECFFLIKGTCTGVPSVYITEYQSTGARNSKKKLYSSCWSVPSVQSQFPHLARWQVIWQLKGWSLHSTVHRHWTKSPGHRTEPASVSWLLYESLRQPADHCSGCLSYGFCHQLADPFTGPVIPGSWLVHVSGSWNQSADSFIGPGIKRAIKVWALWTVNWQVYGSLQQQAVPCMGPGISPLTHEWALESGQLNDFNQQITSQALATSQLISACTGLDTSQLIISALIGPVRSQLISARSLATWLT